jgi:hypothetical protein
MTKLDEIFAKSKEKTQSLLITGKGTRETIYKEELFNELSDKQKKVYRKRVRNYVNNLFTSIITFNDSKQSDKVTKLVNEFNSFYKSTYKVNDYSFASVASENTKDKETINKALSIVKTTLKIK